MIICLESHHPVFCTPLDRSAFRWSWSSAFCFLHLLFRHHSVSPTSISSAQQSIKSPHLQCWSIFLLHCWSLHNGHITSIVKLRHHQHSALSFYCFTCNMDLLPYLHHWVYASIRLLDNHSHHLWCPDMECIQQGQGSYRQKWSLGYETTWYTAYI